MTIKNKSEIFEDLYRSVQEESGEPARDEAYDGRIKTSASTFRDTIYEERDGSYVMITTETITRTLVNETPALDNVTGIPVCAIPRVCWTTTNEGQYMQKQRKIADSIKHQQDIAEQNERFREKGMSFRAKKKEIEKQRNKENAAKKAADKAKKAAKSTSTNFSSFRSSSTLFTSAYRPPVGSGFAAYCEPYGRSGTSSLPALKSYHMLDYGSPLAESSSTGQAKESTQARDGAKETGEAQRKAAAYELQITRLKQEHQDEIKRKEELHELTLTSKRLREEELEREVKRQKSEQDAERQAVEVERQRAIRADQENAARLKALEEERERVEKANEERRLSDQRKIDRLRNQNTRMDKKLAKTVAPTQAAKVKQEVKEEMLD